MSDTVRTGDVDIEGLRDLLHEDAHGADEDADFAALHKLVSGVKLARDDEDVRELRRLVDDHHRQRLHEALDRVLGRLRERTCAGDREFLRRCGVSR